MLSFESDYTEGAHPKILERLIETNMDQLTGYGMDPISESARAKIRLACGRPEADVFLLSGGTQTNKTVIASLLRPFEGVISAVTAHINVHESGAIENSGHKVLALRAADGKLSAEDAERYLTEFHNEPTHDHMVFPGMVYISYPTELGTLYKKSELEALYSVCRRFGIPLFVDGARLGYGLAGNSSDLGLRELASLCDVFYIGGTKVGALIGEAVVFPRGNAPAHFLTMVKQQGALLAKGRLVGVQFDTLFTDGLYESISRHAILMAEELKRLFIRKGYSLFIDSPTNQQFIIMDDEKIAELRKNVRFEFWEKYDDKRSVVRFVTSWATKKESIEALSEYL